MASCLKPRYGWLARVANENGRRPLVFRAELADLSSRVPVPCGKCLVCAHHKGVCTAVRIVHDWHAHGGVGCFVTLTYSPEHRPPGGRLSYAHLRGFYDRAYAFMRERGLRWRAVSCGEFGGRTGHPHYHLVVFGYDFSERARLKSYSRAGQNLRDSPVLNALWPFGEVTVSPMDEGRALYMGHHFVKSFGRDDTLYRFPRRPALGAGWLSSFAQDLRKGFVVLDGRRFPIPDAYMRHPDFYDFFAPVRERRREFAESMPRQDVRAEARAKLAKALNIQARADLKSRGN